MNLPKVWFASGIIFLLSTCAHQKGNVGDAELEGASSPIKSTIDDVSLGNTHAVISDENGPTIVRSQAPKTDEDYNQLKALGISNVLIFKQETRGEVSKEISLWRDKGLSSSNIKSIPMGYINFPDFKTPCLQTIEALAFIDKARRANQKVLFHCTVGEDRTGYLAGIVQLLETSASPAAIFKSEMCQNGYSSGDPRKPRSVCSEIDRDLTPIYLKMAYLIRSGKLSWNKLSTAVCNSDPGNDPGFRGKSEYDATNTQYRCAASSLVK